MRCVECKWWERHAIPPWAPSQPDRWAKLVAEGCLMWGECGRPYGVGFATSLVRIDCSYEMYTHETFGCVQFEAKA